MKNILVDLMLEDLKEQYENKNSVSLEPPTFEETRDDMIKRLQEVYKTVDAIQWALTDWSDKTDDTRSMEITSLAFEVENIVDSIQDVINRAEVL